jgi:AhpD family alkylhydroperoxidase
MATVKFIE